MTISIGSTVNFGTGQFYISVPYRTKTTSIGTAIVSAGGKIYVWAARMNAGTNQVELIPSNDAGVNSPATGAAPIAFASGDKFEIQLVFEQAPRL